MMIWVQLHGLPLECFTEEAGFSLGRAVGDVVKVDMDSLMPCNVRFLRIRVWVFLDKPLSSGFFLKLRDGHQHWVRCCYERMCKVCRNCGRIGHAIATCSLSFAEAQRFLDDHFRDMGRQFHSPVMTQEPHPMYSASIRANAHRSDCHTTRIFQTASSSHMEIPEEVGPSTINQTVTSNDDFAAMWEQDWDDGITIADSTDEVLRALQITGPGPRLNIPMGEAPMLTRAFLLPSPSQVPQMGSAIFEIGQPSSVINLNLHGPPHLPGSTTFTPHFSSDGGPPLRKRMREVDSGYELFYDTEALVVINELRSPGEGRAAELAMHRNGIVSDSKCYPHRLGYFLRNQFSKLKRARPSLPTPVHGHAPLWAIRDTSTKFSALRRRRKLRSRQRKLLAATSSSNSRRGQRSRQRSSSPTPNVLSAST
ncbi:hypothetical protein LOK49_LG01G03388 [Camellia lanceoleosa]|uniref:Uncharacterized protein n=1 Tax=Camellia lanceoleosa TaxID=1840588 RepID=A0ACC0J2G9_9ERIC|nr:hypothetical protein LOK49_LG01G03388 [Camellia lanceoleosa]